MNRQVPVLHPQDDPVDALNLMDQFRVADLPVVEDGIFCGMISETALMSADEVIGQEQLALGAGLLVISVKPADHLYEVLKVATENHLTVIPVVDTEGQYIGSITLEDIVEEVARMQGAHEPGGILVLEMPSKDYSLQQIARIVEENGAKILSSSVHPTGDGYVDVTLKINQPDLNAILQSLDRFRFTVKRSYQEAEYSEGLQKRYEEFMRFLNI
ncbi:MAG: CBS domain-containing protein [Flavobacteriales bacterium]